MGMTSAFLIKLSGKHTGVYFCAALSGTNIKLNTVMRNSAQGLKSAGFLTALSQAHLSLSSQFPLMCDKMYLHILGLGYFPSS